MELGVNSWSQMIHKVDNEVLEVLLDANRRLRLEFVVERRGLGGGSSDCERFRFFGERVVGSGSWDAMLLETGGREQERLRKSEIVALAKLWKEGR